MDDIPKIAHRQGLWTWLRALSSPSVVVYILPWLMVLLTAGTVAQKELGLYRAQEMFFASWILWVGPIPLPGAFPTIGALTLCLAIKFLFFSPWRLDRAGIILTHLGILILLIGGIITAYTQKEGFISFGEGQSANSVADYHERIFTVQKDGEDFAGLPFDDIANDARLFTVELPFAVNALSTCDNCRPLPAQEKEGRHGLAQAITLTPAPPEKENEANLSGITLQFTGLPDGQDGLYVTMEEIPHKPLVSMDGAEYSFAVQRAERELPFSIELVDFKRDLHPGTDMARGFSSDVIVHDGDVSWPATIRMNEPLRYKGYTFYQSSFAMRPDGEYSVLSAVRNQGRIFPYLASAVIFAGLLLHVILRLRRKATA